MMSSTGLLISFRLGQATRRIQWTKRFEHEANRVCQASKPRKAGETASQVQEMCAADLTYLT